MPADVLSPDRIAAALRTRSYGRSLEVHERTGSTNDDVRQAASREVASGHVIAADAQDRGRGAQGRAWSSPPGTDLYFSVLERRTLPAHRLPWLTLAVGLGVRDLVSAHCRGAGRAAIKWPNDVLVGDKKCAGILVESSSSGTEVGPFVIGVGIDVNRTEFSPELEPIATSLLRETGRALPRAELLAEALAYIELRVEQLYAGAVNELCRELRAKLAWVGERVRVDAVEGTLLGLAEDGALVIETPEGPRTVRSGALRRL